MNADTMICVYVQKFEATLIIYKTIALSIKEEDATSGLSQEQDNVFVSFVNNVSALKSKCYVK